MNTGTGAGIQQAMVRRKERIVEVDGRLGGRRRRVRLRARLTLGKISAKCCSFSAVSAPIFARKYTFCSIFQNLPDYQAEIFEIWQHFANFATFEQNFHNNC